jgi:hypothetical protein
MQNTLNGYWSRANTSYKAEVQREYTGYYIYSTQSFVLPKNYFIELSGYYNSGGGWDLNTWKPTGSLDLGFQKKFPKRKSDFRLSVRNLLNTQDGCSTTSLLEQNLYLKHTYKWSSINFSLTFTHNFGNEKVTAKRNRTTGAEEEQGRAN